jgi:hypothetical protein
MERISIPMKKTKNENQANGPVRKLYILFSRYLSSVRSEMRVFVQDQGMQDLILAIRDCIPAVCNKMD